MAQAASKAMVVAVPYCGHLIPLAPLRPLSVLLWTCSRRTPGTRKTNRTRSRPKPSNLSAWTCFLNNAGIFAPKAFLDHTEEDYDRFLGTSPKGKFFMAQSAAKAMKARGGGVIVQTGSMWALQAVGATPSSAYSAASAGAHQMVKNLAIELASRKIGVNAVASAVVKTPMYSTFLSPDQVDAALASFNPEIEDECGLARSLASRVDDSRLFATTEPLLPRDGTS